jgi:arylsulfatase A-like enzyme
LFEGGTRVPALLTWSGVARAGEVNEPLAAIDIAPTLLHNSRFDGTDISGLIQSRSRMAERTLFWEYDGQIAGRRGRWKLLTSHREFLGGPLTQSDWLSDLVNDPAETRNIASEHPEIVASLKREMASWKQKNDAK